MGISSYKDLRVWNGAMELVEEVYRLTKGFPKDEAFGLTSQMRRAAVSVPSNIAEGHTREYRKKYLQHLSLAQASLAELETQIEISLRLKYCLPEQVRQVSIHAVALGKQLYALRNALIKREPTDASR